MVFGPQFNWINSNNFFSTKLIILILGAVGVNLFIFFIFGSYSFLTNLIFISSIFLIFYSLIELKKVLQKKIKFNLPRIISHLGFGMLVLFIGINHQYSLEDDFNLKVGDEKKFSHYEIFFDDIKLKEETNYKAVIGNFRVKNIKNDTDRKSVV